LHKKSLEKIVGLVILPKSSRVERAREAENEMEKARG
jgi:hypothetical protein